MSFYPENPSLGQRLQTFAGGAYTVLKGFVKRLSLTTTQAAAASTTGAHAAVTDNGTQQVITTAITQPAWPRNVTVTFGGTAADIKAIAVIVAGTNMAGAAITETLPAATVDTAGTKTGAKIFKTVTSITIPAHDGTGATTALGYGSKLGFPDKLPHNTVLEAYLDNAKEGTAPTVTTSSSALESNGFTLFSALNGTAVDVYYIG